MATNSLLSAALLAACLVLACGAAAAADEAIKNGASLEVSTDSAMMKKDTRKSRMAMKKDHGTDAMKKDAMKKDGIAPADMRKDGMTKDAMAPDAMKR